MEAIDHEYHLLRANIVLVRFVHQWDSNSYLGIIQYRL